MSAIERFGQNASRGGLAYASGAGKNVSMRHATALNRILQRSRDVLLAHNFAERLRAPFPRDDLIAHGVVRTPRDDERNFGSSAAHEVFPLPLLPSGPGGVRGASLHRARSSTHRRSDFAGPQPQSSTAFQSAKAGRQFACLSALCFAVGAPDASRL